MPKRPKPGHMPDLLPDPAPAPPPADAAAAPEPGPELVPAPPADVPLDPVPDFEARLKAVELVVAEQRAVITRQAMELLLAADNALELRTSRQKVERLKARAEDARLAASAAKKAHEAAVDEHFALEEELSSGQARLPFRDEPEPASASAPEPAPTVVTTAILPPVATEDESWRRVPLGTLGIPEELPHSIVSILGEANLDTIGALSDYLAPAASGYCRKLTDVPGIGPAKAEKVEAALDAFWARWAEWQAHRPEPATAPAEDDGPELTGEYDLDVSLRAGAGPVLPGVKATEDDDTVDFDDEPAEDDAGPGDDYRDDEDADDDDEFDDPDDEAAYEDEAAS